MALKNSIFRKARAMRISIVCVGYLNTPESIPIFKATGFLPGILVSRELQQIISGKIVGSLINGIHQIPSRYPK
jgi:hypothetical protein